MFRVFAFLPFLLFCQVVDQQQQQQHARRTGHYIPILIIFQALVVVVVVVVLQSTMKIIYTTHGRNTRPYVRKLCVLCMYGRTCLAISVPFELIALVSQTVIAMSDLRGHTLHVRTIYIHST